MPRESGSAIAAWARARWPGIRVLFISGYSAASPPGVDDGEPGIAFLGKPFAPQDLIRRVRELLDA
jgi:DNA-binding response OmpR family regulator